MVALIPSFCHKALDDLSKSNMYNLIHQKSKPSVDLAIRHWPRVFVGGVSLMTLYMNWECFLMIGPAIKKLSSVIFNLHGESFFKGVAITGSGLFGLGIPWVLLGDSISGVWLSLRKDDKKRQLGHAQRLLKYWKFRSIVIVFDFAPILYRIYPSFFDNMRENNDSLVSVLVSENQPFVGNLAVILVANFMFYWGLKTLMKDLKGEPRTWWGGKVEGPCKEDAEDKKEQ